VSIHAGRYINSYLNSEEALTTMAHEDAGKYASKHPPSTTLNEQIAKTIREKSSGGKLVCMGNRVVCCNP